MNATKQIVKKELEKHEISKDKKFPIINALSGRLVPKEEYEDLEKEVSKLETEMGDVLTLMRRQQESMAEMRQELRNKRRTGSSIKSNSSSDLSTEEHMLDLQMEEDTEEIEEPDDSENVKVLKKLKDDIGETDKRLQENQREYSWLKSQIDKIKVRIGLKADASMRELDAKIDELCRKGLKEAENYKKQLGEERKKYEELQEIKDELEQEKSLLQKKLQRKENELERLRYRRNAQKTMKSCNQLLHPQTQQARGKINPPLSVNRMNILPRLNPERSNTCLKDRGNCLKCETPMGTSIFCDECVDKTVYK